MSVSYANVVATGSTTPEPIPTKEEVVEQSIETKDVSAEESKEQSQLPSPKPSPKAEKASPKVLAPAPVPQVSAWSSANSSRSNSNVDEKHWPSPLEIPQAQQQQSITSKKIIASKTSKEKWVPFKASVVLPQSGKKQGNNQNQKRSSQKNNGNVLSQNNKQQPQFSQEKKRKNKPQEKKSSSAPSTQKKESKEEKTVSKDESLSEANQQQASQQQQQQHQNQQHQHQNQHSQSVPQFPPQQRNMQQFTPAGQQFIPQQFQGQRQFRPNYNYQSNNRRYNKFNGSQSFRQNGFVPHYRRNNFTKEEPLFSLTKQLEYYFSMENLVKDVFLRKQMNDEGWLDVQVIANFYRMQVLSSGDINLVKKGLEVLNGGILELGEFEDDLLKVRVKENFANWILPVEQRDENGQDGKKLLNIIPSKTEPVTEEKTEA